MSRRRVKDMGRDQQKAVFASYSNPRSGRARSPSHYKPPKTAKPARASVEVRAASRRKPEQSEVKFDRLITDLDGLNEEYSKPEYQLQKQQSWEDQQNEYEMKEREKWKGINSPKDLPGKRFYTSWGYDQTNYDYIIVKSVSPSGKSAICQRVSHDDMGYSGQSYIQRPNDDTFGDEFRMKIEPRYDESLGITKYTLRGSYPFCHDGEMDRGKRLDTFWIAGEKQTFYETDSQFGH